MFRTTVVGSFSKSDLEDDLDHKELSPLTDDKEVLKGFRGMPMLLTENFLRKRSSASSPKSPDRESTPSDEKLGSSVTGGKATKSSAEHTNVFVFPLVNENHESKDTTVIDIGPKDNYLKGGCMPTSNQRLEGTFSSNGLAGILNRSNTNEVPCIKVRMPSEERHELQELKHGNHLDHRLESTSSSNRANGLGRNANDTIIEIPQDLISSKFFSYIYSICEEEGFYKKDFYQEINLLHAEHRLYDVLLSQNEKDQDTPLHVAIKKGKIDLTKEILHILDEPYKLDEFYQGKYFEHEKPLFKVVSTKNKEGKSVITLVIEGNDLEHIAAVFECLPFDGEKKQLLIERCGKVKGAFEALEDNNKKSARAKWFLSKGKLIFALLAGCSFVTTVCRFIYNAANERTSLHHVTIKHTSPYNYNTSSYNATIEYASSPGFTDDGIFQLAFSFTGLMIFLNYVSSNKLSSYKKKDSILEKELKDCTERRDKLGSGLESALKHEVYTEELVGLKKKVSFLEKSYSTQVNSASVQPVDPGSNSVFANPSA